MNIEIITRNDLKSLKEELLLELRSILSTSSKRKEVLTNNEVKEILDVSTSTLQNYRKQRIIPYSKVGSNIYYNYEDILKFISDHRREAISPNDSSMDTDN